MWLIGWDTRAPVGKGVDTELETLHVAYPRINGARAHVVHWVGH